MVTANKYIYASRFNGFPTDEHIKLVEEELPDLHNGEVRFAAVYLSVDPYVRCLDDHYDFPVGSTIPGEQVAKVVVSKNPDYNVGEHYLINTGWRNISQFTPTAVKPGDLAFTSYTRATKVVDYDGLPISLALGMLGMPGATASTGLKMLNLQQGETIFVNAAAGAVGSLVGQVAKIKGCKVIGCVGSNDKMNWLKEIGFDVVFNYKTDDLGKALSEAAPNGLNCFFDNVGGAMSLEVMKNHMAQFGRIVLCGAIAEYNDDSKKVPMPFLHIIEKSLTLRGINCYQDLTPAEWTEAFDRMAAWIKEGKLKYREQITEGFENMRKAFYELFTGANIGKSIIKA